MLLQRTERLHECALKVGADAHNLAGRLHLCGQMTGCGNKFIKRKTRHLYHAVVKGRLKAGVRLSCNCVLDLIQVIAQSDLGGNLGDRIAGRFGRQSGRTADTRVYLDDAVLKAVRMQGKLYVTSAFHTQLGDDVQRRISEHLVLFISECLGRSHNDAVAGVHAHRVDIFHVTDGDAGAVSVPHDLILDLLPAGDAALHEHLSHTA